jgi:NADH:ubiquinone oxidoreductase subunit E
MSHGPSASGGALVRAPGGHHAHEPYVPVFTGVMKERLEETIAKYPQKMAALLPALWMVQEARG